MTGTGIYSNSFAQAFSQILEKAGTSCYQISEYSHLDQAYLSRLKSGEKKNPSVETLFKISLAVTHCSTKVSLHDIQKLFKSLGRSFEADGDY